MKIDPDDLLTVGEAAELRGVTHQSISYLVKMGRVRTVTIRGRTHIYRKDIEEFTPGKPGPQAKATAKKRTKKRSKKTGGVTITGGTQASFLPQSVAVSIF